MFLCSNVAFQGFRYTAISEERLDRTLICEHCERCDIIIKRFDFNLLFI